MDLTTRPQWWVCSLRNALVCCMLACGNGASGPDAETTPDATEPEGTRHAADDDDAGAGTPTNSGDTDDSGDAGEVSLGADAAVGDGPAGRPPGDGGAGPGTSESMDPPRVYVDPGTATWERVPRDQVVELCKLDPDILDHVDATMGVSWAIVRYGRLCWEYYPPGQAQDATFSANSATKTMGAAMIGIAARETKDIPRTGPRTGPLSDLDRVDHWLDIAAWVPTLIGAGTAIHPDAHLAHLLSMTAQNADLSFGNKRMQYFPGHGPLESLVTILDTVIAQDPQRLGSDVQAFYARYLHGPLGMQHSVWNGMFQASWAPSVRDMARVGLFILNDGHWDGRQLMDAEWAYKMTHPSFEDAGTHYGYLTWLIAKSNWHLGELEFVAPPTLLDPGQPMGDCLPAAINTHFPHGLSQAIDCNYDPPYDCDQQFDVGVWQANGALGQLIIGHPGLDMVVVTRDLTLFGAEGFFTFGAPLWDLLRPAVVALDPVHEGDEAAFCEAYGSNNYAPDS